MQLLLKDFCRTWKRTNVWEKNEFLSETIHSLIRGPLQGYRNVLRINGIRKPGVGLELPRNLKSSAILHEVCLLNFLTKLLMQRTFHDNDMNTSSSSSSSSVGSYKTNTQTSFLERQKPPQYWRLSSACGSCSSFFSQVSLLCWVLFDFVLCCGVRKVALSFFCCCYCHQIIWEKVDKEGLACSR